MYQALWPKMLPSISTSISNLPTFMVWSNYFFIPPSVNVLQSIEENIY